MYNVIKNKRNIVKAYRLGSENEILDELINEGKVVPLGDGRYEIFSQEVLIAGSEHGELALIGDYVKIDSAGDPYPNSKEFFDVNHRHLYGDEYEQIPKTLKAWDMKEPMCEEVEYLMREKGLILNIDCPERCFVAPLWGTIEAADINAVLVFYDIIYNNDGSIADANYNLVSRTEFVKAYSVC